MLSYTCGSSSPVDLGTIDRAWACVAANVVKKAYDAYGVYTKQGKQKDEALEMCSQERFIAAKVHTTGTSSHRWRYLIVG